MCIRDRDCVERRAGPPCLGVRGIGDAHVDTQLQPWEGLAHPPYAAGIHIQCGDAQAGITFSQMRGFAAGGGAGIQHARMRRRRQRIGHRLRCAILHRDRAILEVGQLLHRQRGLQPQCVGQIRRGLRGDAGRVQGCQIGITCMHAAVHPQPQRRFLRAGGKNRIGLLRPVGTHLLRQPVRPRGIGRRLRQAFALRPPQQGIDHTGLMHTFHRARSLHRGVHSGMRGQAEFQLRKPGQQQGVQVVVAHAEGFLQPLRKRRIHACALTQRRHHDGLDQGAVARVGQRWQCAAQRGLQ